MKLLRARKKLYSLLDRCETENNGMFFTNEVPSAVSLYKALELQYIAIGTMAVVLLVCFRKLGDV